MPESCNSRRFSWLVKSCFPSPQDTRAPSSLPQPIPDTTTLSSLPDDLLLECLSRVPPSSLPSLSLVCRRWTHLLSSPSFLFLRRLRGNLHDTVFALSATDSGLYAAILRLDRDPSWKLSMFLPDGAASASRSPSPSLLGLFSNASLAAIGHRIYIVGRNGTARYDTWTGQLTAKAPMLFPRKKFAVAEVRGKIYVAGGGPRATTVEEYEPESDTWRVVSQVPRRRYGCVGAAVDGVFYVIGGLKIGGTGDGEFPRASAGAAEAHLYASSMDLFDVEARVWLRSRSVPGGGCVVAACASAGHVYVLASHAVELSFWRFGARRKGGDNGEWCRMKAPPLPAQVRLDSTVRFSCVGVGTKVFLIQVMGCIDDLLRRSGRSVRGYREGLVLVYDTAVGEWSRAADLPEVIRRAACVSVEC